MFSFHFFPSSSSSSIFLPLLALLASFSSSVRAQLDASLLSGQNYAPKPTVPPDLAKYFELDGHARELVDTLIAPRPGGFFPEKTYEISAPKLPPPPTEAPDQLQQIGKAVEQFLSGPAQPGEFQLPPGFNQGFSIGGAGGKNNLAFQQNANPVHVDGDQQQQSGSSSGDDTRRRKEEAPAASKSSIAGIPNDFPKLPKFPMSVLPAEIRRQQPLVMRQPLELPKFASKPEVPEGGLGPAGADPSDRPGSVSESGGLLTSNAVDTSEYGGLSEESPAPGGLIGTVLDLFGFNKEGKPAPDAGGIGRAVGNLLGGSNSPLPGKQFINNVLYKALTSGSVQQSPALSNDSSASSNASDPSASVSAPVLPTLPPVLAALLPDLNSSTPITLTAAQQEAIGENLEMIQNLIVQPSSPLCNPKPVPVDEFSMDAFMGQWYQVLYSPPLAQSACSVVSYRKLADINHGGIGSIFEVFEYTTDGTPYSKPKITSGYAILKQVGELIFRTTAHQEDVNIHVLFNGPLNEKGQYEFTVVSTNCNYPIYVFARDPVIYKQRYEQAVQQLLEQRGIVNGISKLLNIVAPVDATACTFPANLFNNNDKLPMGSHRTV